MAEQGSAPVQEVATVTLTVTMTPEEYVRISGRAKWDGKPVGQWLIDGALGRNPRGC